MVSFPCWELFKEQPKAYQDSVYPKDRKYLKVYVESCSTSWGIEGGPYADVAVTMNSFGVSAPGKAAKEDFGFTVPNICERVKKGLAEFK